MQGQNNITFHHITTLNGLSDNNVTNTTIDKNGFLWICTSEGLNKYDGRVMETYYKEDHPELGNNNIREVVCDDRNRLWIRTFGGFISMLDEQRRWHAIHIKEKGVSLDMYNIVSTKSKGIILFHGKNQFRLKPGSDTSFERWHFDADTLFEKRLYYHSYITPDKVLWTASNELFIMNYATGKIEYRKTIPAITSATTNTSDELYITTAESGGFYKLNIKTGELQSLQHFKDQYGTPMFSSLQMVKKMGNGKLIITSDFAGLYVYDPNTNQLLRYVHDPLNSRSISSNNYFNLVTDSSGYVFVTSATSGLSYFNIKDNPAAWVSTFRNDKGEVFDGYVNAIIPAAEPGAFWLGCYNQLIKWDKKTNRSTFFDYGTGINGTPNKGNDEVLCISKDYTGKIWLGTGKNGIVILSANGDVLKEIKKDAASIPGLPDNHINQLFYAGKDMWAATSGGLCRLDVSNYTFIPIVTGNALLPLTSMSCGTVWKDSRGRLWVGAGREGAFCYDPGTNTLRNYVKAKAGASNDVYAFSEDANANIYIGTRTGLVRLENDNTLLTFDRNSGLRGDRCENILKDASGNLWLENGNSIVRFNPVGKSFTFFDEKSGFSPFGFRVRSGYSGPDGYLFFGSEKGLSYFHPDSLKEPPMSLSLSVNSIQANQEINAVTGSADMEFGYNNNDLVFHFSAIDLGRPRSILFRYRLIGYDKEWNNAVNISSVRYNSLRPAKYQFEIKASTDGEKWVNALYPVAVQVKPAFWQTWLFRFSTALALALLFYFSLKQREKGIEARATERTKAEELRAQALQYQLEIEQVINYFATSLTGLQSVEDALWDVVKTCISQLGFQDCVIYFYNKERTMLIQKAAHGPKNIDYREIFNRIEIPPGSGIVGTVAKTGIAEIINNTALDSRYIPDDAVRLSEIAVPIIGASGVLGVIDSEHAQANFYTNRHLQILTAIATMVANKTEQLEAEADTKQKEVELARMQRDVATFQLTATRAQMNPHFIFNALNSVQQYILQGNTDDANKYLSRFSRLQREILNHCDRPSIPLQKEMDMLHIYLELEQLRFNGSFDFTIEATADIDAEEIKIPPMMLQPFVENAIWHGLMPKETNRKVSISFRLDEKDDEVLHCTIEDNGVGRSAAAAIKAAGSPHPEHVSKGLGLVNERLKLMQQQSGRLFAASIKDILDEGGNVAGTRVELVMFTGF